MSHRSLPVLPSSSWTPFLCAVFLFLLFSSLFRSFCTSLSIRSYCFSPFYFPLLYFVYMAYLLNQLTTPYHPISVTFPTYILPYPPCLSSSSFLPCLSTIYPFSSSFPSHLSVPLLVRVEDCAQKAARGFDEIALADSKRRKSEVRYYIVSFYRNRIIFLLDTIIIDMLSLLCSPFFSIWYCSIYGC